MSLKILNHISDIGQNLFNGIKNPFVSYELFSSLEKGDSVGLETGCEPLYFTDGKNLLYTFKKNHSYGEYIFDWEWANAYHRYQIPYYPKLTSMIPFTSVTVPHMVGDNEKLLDDYEKFYDKEAVSSSHFLFIKPEEIPLFEKRDYLIRHSFQYHFKNDGYADFDEFLCRVKSRKAKQIRKERCFDEKIKINQFTANDLTKEHAYQMYLFYLSTIKYKGAIAYLNQDVFASFFENMKNNLLYVQAEIEDKPIAGALYFYDSDRLYGRYWGCQYEIPNLHFELCYYQGIDFCLRKKLEVFEAGAQGEHKIPRGFAPQLTYSAHKFKHADFHTAIGDFIKEEKKQIKETIEYLKQKLPFKQKD